MLTKATYVYPEGDKEKASLIICGDQPIKQEVLYGKPFIGTVGQELDDCLHKSGILRSETYLTNVFKDLDRPLQKYMDFKEKGVVISPEGNEYIDELRDEISNSTASVIIALNNAALFALTGRYGITKWRGSILDCTLVPGKIVVPSLHPESILRPKNQYLNKHLLVFDLKRAKEIKDGNYVSTARKLIIKPVYRDVLEYLSLCLSKGAAGSVIDYDIEITNMEVSCISFAYKPDEAICIPFISGAGDYFNPEEELEIWIKIAQILEAPNIAKRGQNLCFDVHFLLRKFGIAPKNLHDTMVAQRILMPDYKIGLDFITSIWTDLPYYKEDGKQWIKGVTSWERGWEYNARDSIVCAEAGPKQLKELAKQGNSDTYERTRRIIPPLVYMMEHGIRVNLTGMKEAYRQKAYHIEFLKKELNRVAGQELNSNSPKQLKQYFYIDKGLPSYKKAGGITTDELAMKRIARKGFKEAKLVLAIRKAVKERSTYFDPDKIDTDSRCRCSYNPVGTRYSRISSRESLFGTGNNLQNQPYPVLPYYIADDGYCIYRIDLSQAENRIVAYVGRIAQMIEAFESGQDVHTMTAKIILNTFYGELKAKEILAEDSKLKRTMAPMGDGSHEWRFWGKKANHGLNYDFGYRQFALRYEIPEAQGKFIVNTYHKAYPGVRNNFHAYVKKCLFNNRTLINLMGRKTLFLDRLEDQLFKESYACIPQGTVGDVINERGMNYIYYNQDIFRDVELLLQVHDDLTFQIPTPFHATDPVPWGKHAYLLWKIKKSLEIPLVTHYGREFVIPAEIIQGISLDKGAGVEHSNFPKDLDECAKLLEKTYYDITRQWLPVRLI